MHFTLEAKFRSVLISNTYSLLLGLSKLDYNLGQNKVEQQTPIPPQIKDEVVQKPKHAIFPSLILGRGGRLQILDWVDHVLLGVSTNV